MPFHGYVTAALVAGLANYQVSPTGLAGVCLRMNTEADAWSHFRVKALAVRLHRNNATTGAQAIGYVGGVQDTLPASVQQVAELIPSAISGDQITIPGEWVRPTAKELAGPLPWYKSINGAADITEEAPGYIVIAGSGVEVYSLEIRCTIEFKTSVATANTPAEIRLLSQLRAMRLANAQGRARNAVARLLTGSGPVSSGPAVTLPSAGLRE